MFYFVIEWSIPLARGEAEYQGGNARGSRAAHLITWKQKTAKDQNALQRYILHPLRPSLLTYPLMLLLPINFNRVETKFLTLGPLGSIYCLNCGRLDVGEAKSKLHPVFAHMEFADNFPSSSLCANFFPNAQAYCYNICRVYFLHLLDH